MSRELDAENKPVKTDTAVAAVVRAYCRVSTEGQAEGGVSLKAQQEKVAAHALLRGLSLGDRLYVDPGVTSKIPFRERPAGRRLMGDLTKGEHLIIPLFWRAFRDVVDCLNTVEILDNRGVTMHILDLWGEPIVSTAPFGKLMLTIFAGIGNMMREQTRETIKEAFAYKRSTGERTSSDPGIGFKWHDTKERRRRGNAGDFFPVWTKVEDWQERKVLAFILDLYKQGWPCREIESYLAAHPFCNNCQKDPDPECAQLGHQIVKGLKRKRVCRNGSKLRAWSWRTIARAVHVAEQMKKDGVLSPPEAISCEPLPASNSPASASGRTFAATDDPPR